MAIDPRFIVMPLQEFFIDKDTGLPLDGGILDFFKDNSRTDRKAIYTISGTPPNYTYVELPNPLTLSSVGTPQDDNGNDVLIYYFPYDGTPDDSQGDVELYFVRVRSAGLVPQFTREGIPNFDAGSAATSSDNVNYIPNGQFLAHTDVPLLTNGTPVGQITQAVTEIAQGGWTFERDVGSTSVDNVTFQRYGSIVDSPTGNPRYALKVTTSSPDSGDNFKNICIKFRNVNTFASATQNYTFAFTAQTLNAGTLAVSLDSIKYFGAGGSATVNTTIPVTGWTITPSEQVFSVSFIFGTNESYTLGTDDSDYIQVVLKLPTSVLLSAAFTDFILTPGANVIITEFPVQTEANMLAQGVAGWMPVPNPDGSDLYLPLVLTQQGLAFDDSQVGFAFPALYDSPAPAGYLDGDGTQYKTNLYSSIGIPYRRVQAKLFKNIGAIGSAYIQVPKWGTGLQFMTAWNVAVPPGTEVIIRNNSAGVVSATADGAVATTFTFANTYIATATGYALTAYWVPAASTNIYIANTQPGVVASPGAGNSGFTGAIFRTGVTDFVNQIGTFQTTAATSLAGKYCTFVSNATYYIWFKVNGSGSDPAPGGTGILVSLNSTDDADTVAHKIVDALNGGQVSSIKVLAGASVVPNSYFTINSTTTNYYVWYSLNGAGTDPAPVNRTGIEVPYTLAQTANQVAIATQLAINSQYFAIPQLQGAFLRGVDPNQVLDIGGLRLSVVDGVQGNVVGSYQWDANQAIPPHTHLYEGNNELSGGNTSGTDGTNNPDDTGETAATSLLNGYFESRPKNFAVNYVIKY